MLPRGKVPRQLPHDRLIRRPLALREHETEEVGAELRGEEGVVGPREPADLDEGPAGRAPFGDCPPEGARPVRPAAEEARHHRAGPAALAGRGFPDQDAVEAEPARVGGGARRIDAGFVDGDPAERPA